jgi:hypothetical protein
MPVIPATGEAEVGGLWSQTVLGKSMRPYPKVGGELKQKGVGGASQMVECLPSKHKALSSSVSCLKVL